MALKGVNYPSAGAASNMYFKDSAWGTQEGVSIWHQAPVLAALSTPGDYGFDWEDFNNLNPTTAETWTATTVGTGTYTLSAVTPGGVLLLTTSAASSDANQLQKLGCYNLHATKKLYAEWYIAVDTLTSVQLHVGLSVTDTSLAASDPTDGIYFSKDSADNNIDAVTSASSTSTDTDTTSDIAAATFVRLGMIATTASVGFYVDGVLKTTSTTNIPGASVDLRPSISILTASAAAKVLSVDYMGILQAR